MITPRQTTESIAHSVSDESVRVSKKCGHVIAEDAQTTKGMLPY